MKKKRLGPNDPVKRLNNLRDQQRKKQKKKELTKMFKVRRMELSASRGKRLADLQYWPIYYGFFLIKCLKNCVAHRKKFSVIVRETHEEENAKLAAFHAVYCGRRKGLKSTRKSSFTMSKKFSIHFSKKLLGEKSVYIKVLNLLSRFAEYCFINKK